MTDETFSNGFWLGGELVTAETAAKQKAAPAPSGDVAALTKERDEWKAKAEAAEGQKAIPEDALARLEGVSGIGKDLAKKALAALTAAPAGS